MDRRNHTLVARDYVDIHHVIDNGMVKKFGRRVIIRPGNVVRVTGYGPTETNRAARIEAEKQQRIDVLIAQAVAWYTEKAENGVVVRTLTKGQCSRLRV